MEQSQGCDAVAVSGTRRYSSPNRVLARAFRIGRDGWKKKHQLVQSKLAQQRQLVAERGQSRDEWRRKYEAAVAQVRTAESLAEQHQQELAQLGARVLELEAQLQKKRGVWSRNRMVLGRGEVRRL